MTHPLISFLTLHIFVCFGWLAKRIFKTKLDEQSLVLISVYFLQPILIFWGLLQRPLDFNLCLVPSLYLVSLIVASILLCSTHLLKIDKKEQSILKITGIISNTGNLGIPLGLLLFGPTSVPFTSMINLINAIYIFTVGAYIYSRGTFSIKKSCTNVLKLPMIWAALLAIISQLSALEFPELLMHVLKMGAYSTMVLQLIIFGSFIATIQYKHVNFLTITGVQCIKFLFFPAILWIIIQQINLPTMALQCLILQSFMPIAVNNLNFAALYDCYPKQVAMHAVISSLIALIVVPIIL